MTPALALWVGVYWCTATSLHCGVPYTVHDHFVGPTYFLSQQSCLAEAKQRAEQSAAEHGDLGWQSACVPQRDGQVIAGIVRP